MAILDFFEVAVSINGQRASEYDDVDSETKTFPNPKVVTKYVEAVAGTNFAVDLCVKDDYAFDCDYIAFNIELDGTFARGRAVSFDHPRSSRVEGVKGLENGQLTLRKFKFGDLAITDDGSDLSLSEEKIKYLGMIRVEVYRHELAQIITDGHHRHRNSTGEESVPEKALKGRAVTLSTRLDKGVPAKGGSAYIGPRLDDAPVASFHFKYRSRKALQDLLIIPRSPSPVPLDERPIEDLSAEEARELVRKQRDNQQGQGRIKREIKQEQERNSSKHSRPESPIIPSRSYKVARTEDGIEVLDLADDSDDQATSGSGNTPANGTNTNGNGNRVIIVDLED